MVHSYLARLIASLAQVKAGGHAYNAAFSATMGVQIALNRLDQGIYDSRTKTATRGTGLTWESVYGRLEPHGVMVAGGRVPGIGKSSALNIASEDMVRQGMSFT